jgi:hypothetical protein
MGAPKTMLNRKEPLASSSQPAPFHDKRWLACYMNGIWGGEFVLSTERFSIVKSYCHARQRETMCLPCQENSVNDPAMSNQRCCACLVIVDVLALLASFTPKFPSTTATFTNHLQTSRPAKVLFGSLARLLPIVVYHEDEMLKIGYQKDMVKQGAFRLCGQSIHVVNLEPTSCFAKATHNKSVKLPFFEARSKLA